MKARSQKGHEEINAREYPGTRQLCVECEEPTKRCEEDALYADDDGQCGPLCEDCYDKAVNKEKVDKAVEAAGGIIERYGENQLGHAYAQVAATMLLVAEVRTLNKTQRAILDIEIKKEKP